LVSEKQRIEEFDRIKANVEKMNLNAEEQRKAFLSELSKIYPRGVTEEVVEAKNYRILRHVINQDGIVTVYEQRTWDWGGVFWFKNGDVNITESLYKLELSKIGK
jgi:ribosomal protein S18